MSKRLLTIAGSLALTLACAGLAVAQDTKTTTTVTTQTTKTIQNPDGTYTVVQYPVDKEVTVNLTPGTLIPTAKGLARVRRHGDMTTINLNLSDITGDTSSYNVYAVDPMGHFTLLGPVTIANGVATQTFTTPMDKFMLVLSPEANLTTIADNTPILFRSTVPEGMAVVPVAQSRPREGAAVGEHVAATTTSASSAYNVPMLGIPSFKLGKETHMRIDFRGDLAGSHANAFILPRTDGPTQIKVRFHDLKKSDTPDTRIVVWAVGPDNQFVKIGQIVNTGRRNETEIKGETALKDFGLFITAEPTDTNAPTAPIVGTMTIVPD